MSKPAGKLTVAFLTLPESTGSTLYGMYDLFASVERDWGLITEGEARASPFRPVTVTAHPGGFRMANGIHVLPDTTITEAGIPDIVCVPELLVPPGADISGRYAQEVDWLRTCYEAGSYLGAACSGALLLAETGLLDGCEATTHWAYCDMLAERYPHVRVERHRALVTAGEGQRIVMVGGGSSWQDLALFLIARCVGLERALQVAKIYLIDWHRAGQQPYTVLTCRAQTEDAAIARCQRWLAENYDHYHPVQEMTRLSGLTVRSFKRRFRQATGMPPIDYVHTLRVEEAKQWLESTGKPVEAVAEAVGYEDASFFSRLFRRKVGLTPAQYRRRFGALGRVLAGEGIPVVEPSD
ncbi:GlxA family transcriptional regulator [Arhodomonas sp. SL1]|uniref:GlxA family transcriptional regulator n=1 Tax=Arhodomonas sp. SL1 TaxID=3425691 RepID=UPI003F884CE8